MAGKPIPDDCILHKCKSLRARGGKRWLSEDGKRIYTWDTLHGEIEVYNLRGFHLGVIDCEGELIKEAVKGRKIDVS